MDARRTATSRAMLLQWISLVCAAHATRGALQITGEVSFHLRVADRNEDDTGNEIQTMLHDIKSRIQFTKPRQSDSSELKKMEARRDSDFDVNVTDDIYGAKVDDVRAIGTDDNNNSDNADFGDRETQNITAAPQTSCDYQFPERRQTNAMLSYMMNQLTKMFVRLSAYMRRMTRSDYSNKRFTQIPSKHSDFFEEVFFNMTNEFQSASEAARTRVFPLRRAEPCAHQGPLRAAWAKVLRAAQGSLSRAAKRVLDWHLQAQSRAGPDTNVTARAARHAAKFLRRELATVHSGQLELLCEEFQLCYHDLVSKPANDNDPSAPSPKSITEKAVKVLAFSVIKKKLPTTTPVSSPTNSCSSTPAFSTTPGFPPTWSPPSILKIRTTSTDLLPTISPDSSALPYQNPAPSPSAVTTTTYSVPPTTTPLEPFSIQAERTFAIPDAITTLALNSSELKEEVMHINGLVTQP